MTNNKQQAFYILRAFLREALAGVFIITVLLSFGCREDEVIITPEETQVTTPENNAIRGFYLLNEGNMGTNKASLDFFDAERGVYQRNIYSYINPSTVKGLGDVGNDIKIYGSKLYALINCSNKVEVMDVKTAKRLGQIDIQNCRYIQFYEGFAYVTSYAGPVQVGNSQLGYVAKIDTTDLKIIDECTVGYQPDELAVCDGKIYVANSGGYDMSKQENTLSVIDINSFDEVKKIAVAPNLHRVQVDKYGKIWVSSRGDASNQSCLVVLEKSADRYMVTDTLNVLCSNFTIDDDYLYALYADKTSSEAITSYVKIDIRSKEVIAERFISNDISISLPYGIAIHPLTKDIFISDAKTYIVPGAIYCFDKNGNLKWNVRTGDIPSSIAFVYK